jgi:acyl-coenzyme A thioesterase PaaI-like protein
VFSRILGLMVPYSGTVGATVLQLEPGRVRVRLVERRRIRNHLGSIHAIALANVGELASGLALVGALGPEARGILTGIEVRYTKKARGTLEAESRCAVPEVTETIDHSVEAEIRDAEGDVVATVTAHWRLGPVRERGR